MHRLLYNFDSDWSDTDGDSEPDIHFVNAWDAPANLSFRDNNSHDPVMASSIPTTIPELKEISVFTVALALWKHISIPVGRPDVLYMNYSNEWSTSQIKVRGLTPALKLPKSIAGYIDKYIEKISAEIRQWITYHFQAIYFNNGNDYYLYYHVNHLLWYPNATINYKATARNLLKSLRLSDMEKYRLMCTYCLKEELERVSPELYSNNVMDKITFSSNPLIYYWNCHFRNELNKITANRNAAFEISLDHFMLNTNLVDNWSAKEYFFDRMSAAEQTQSAISLIAKHGLKYQKMLLKKLNESQRLHVYLNKAVDIIVNYADAEEDHTEDLLSTWLDVRRLITDEQFVSLLGKLVTINRSRIDVTLNDIWIHACDDFKHHIINFNNNKIIEDVFRWWEYRLKVEFPFTILSDLNNDIKDTITKKQYFRDCCNRLLSCSEYSIFDRLLKSCFSDADELATFQRDIVFENSSIRDKCSSYYRSGDLVGLNTFLTPLLSNSNSILDYKTNVLMSQSGITSCVNHMGSPSKRSTLNNIIADGLPTEDLVTEFKKKLMFSKSCIHELRTLIENNKLDKIEQRINRFLSSERDKKSLKKQLIANPKKLMQNTFRKYDESWWRTLLQWCLKDAKAIEEYKSTLDVDEIFDEILKVCVFKRYDYSHRVSFCSFHNEVVFDAVDRFLKWYFVSASEIKQYKVRRIESWLDVRTINTLLRKKNNRYLIIVMNWFFQNNAKQMAKFKKKYKGERVAEVL